MAFLRRLTSMSNLAKKCIDSDFFPLWFWKHVCGWWRNCMERALHTHHSRVANEKWKLKHLIEQNKKLEHTLWEMIVRKDFGYTHWYKKYEYYKLNSTNRCHFRQVCSLYYHSKDETRKCIIYYSALRRLKIQFDNTSSEWWHTVIVIPYSLWLTMVHVGNRTTGRPIPCLVRYCISTLKRTLRRCVPLIMPCKASHITETVSVCQPHHTS